ncbi:MAG: hypothetical protein IKD55_00875 [Sediminibacterium sp.]|nr:hypothetical protein [Sediminibacterium sp.]
MKLLQLGFICIYLTYSSQSLAQKFSSKFYTSPTLLNPANTGNFIADYRVGGVSRTEKNGLVNDISYFFSYDSKILKNIVQDKDRLAIGISALSESDRYFGLFDKSIFLSLAYFKGLNESGDEKIGIGFQVASTTKTKETPTYIFTNQVETAANYGFSGLNFFSPKVSVSYLDFNAGISYQKTIQSKHLISFGLSILHITKPQKKIDGGEFMIDSKVGLQNVNEFEISNRNKILTNFNLNSDLGKGNIRDLSFGCIYQVGVGQTFYKISGGTFIKYDKIFGTIFSPTIGLKLLKLNIQITYDIVSSKEIYNRRNAFEFGMFYTGMLKSNTK